MFETQADAQALMVALMTATSAGDDETALALLADLDHTDLELVIFALCGVTSTLSDRLAKLAGRNLTEFQHELLTGVGVAIARKQ